jgi:hypothetical protein
MRAGPSPFYLGLFIFFLVTSLLGCRAESGTAAGEEGVIAAELRSHVDYLASDDLAGRETGTPGIRKAEEYIAGEFRSYGLSPLPGQREMYHDVTLYRWGYDMEKTSLAFDLGEGFSELVAAMDFTPFPFSDAGQIEAGIVFAGYGITAPEYEYDDYSELDVEGKFVLLLRHEPNEADPQSVFNGTYHTRHALFRTKAVNARNHGAAGMILATDPLNHLTVEDLRFPDVYGLDPSEGGDQQGDDGRSSSGPDGESAGSIARGSSFLAVHVSQPVGEKIVGAAGRRMAELQRAVDRGTRPSKLAVRPGTARINIAHTEAAVIEARNVAGFLEGADAELKEQWIVVGGHHDHLGSYPGPGDTIYNGADDNASGVSGVLELAEAFSSLSERPARSMVFITFTGEEKGFLGSRAVLEDGVLPADRISFMMNLDMIGRGNNGLEIYGDGFTSSLRGIIGRTEGDIATKGAGTSSASDHVPFRQRRIPFLSFFTGDHENYHRPGDHGDRLDYSNMEAIVRLAYRILMELAAGSAE